MDQYEISKVNLGKKKYICFGLLVTWILFFLKKRKKPEEHP